MEGETYISSGDKLRWDDWCREAKCDDCGLSLISLFHLLSLVLGVRGDGFNQLGTAHVMDFLFAGKAKTRCIFSQ